MTAAVALVVCGSVLAGVAIPAALAFVAPRHHTGPHVCAFLWAGTTLLCLSFGGCVLAVASLAGAL